MELAVLDGMDAEMFSGWEVAELTWWHNLVGTSVRFDPVVPTPFDRMLQGGWQEALKSGRRSAAPDGER